MPDEFADYPEVVPAGSGFSHIAGRDFHKVENAFWLKEPGPLPAAPLASIEGSEGRFAIYERAAAAASALPAGAEAGPVYALVPGGPFYVPTGCAFVRLRDGVSPRSHRDRLREAGFEIARTQGQGAWLRPVSGRVADGLNRLPRLADDPDVVSVEPQMLTQRAHR